MQRQEGISQEEISFMLSSTLPPEELLEKMDEMAKKQQEITKTA